MLNLGARKFSPGLGIFAGVICLSPAVGATEPSQDLNTAAGLVLSQAAPAPLPAPGLPENRRPFLDITPREPETLPEEDPQPPPTPPELEVPNGVPQPESPRSPAAPSEPQAATLCVQGFRVVHNSVFSAAEFESAIEAALQAAGAPETGADRTCPQGRLLTFNQILLARTAVTNLYLREGYRTSGAIIPAGVPLVDGVVTIQAVEGRLEDIQVNGARRLHSGYISSRLGIAASPPLNVDRLLQGLQLLQLNPLIDTIRADLQAGTTPGTNLLVVDVVEADSFAMNAFIDNSRSPSVGSFRRGIGLQEGNLLGLGDALSVSYINTNGSNEFSANYRVPVNPYNGTLELAATVSNSRVIEYPFQPLAITADASDYNLTLKQPIIQTPTRQLDLGLSLSRQFSQTFLGFEAIGPFPFSLGADGQGRTVVTALRFHQTWTQRSTEQVFAARSQFSLGLGSFLGGTVNADAALPDNHFFFWQGQAQWVRQLAPDTLFLLRGSSQLSFDSLLSPEKYGLGGQATVRGYRQDELLTDSAIQATAEFRLPLVRIPDENTGRTSGLLQFTPFIDAGYGWNVSPPYPERSTLVGIGAGLLWQQPNLTARVDYGLPLIASNSRNRDTLQENGIYFSVSYSFF